MKGQMRVSEVGRVRCGQTRVVWQQPTQSTSGTCMCATPSRLLPRTPPRHSMAVPARCTMSARSSPSSHCSSPVAHSTPTCSAATSTASILSPLKPPIHITTIPATVRTLPIDYSYYGTYLFLAGCLVFSFHSIVLLCEDGLTFANSVYFVGATLFTCGSVCYAVDAEQRTYRGKGS